MKWLDKIPLSLIVILALTVGLAPFVPEPHLIEKLKMLLQGDLVRPMDIFDLIFHGLPVALLAAKIIRGKTVPDKRN